MKQGYSTSRAAHSRDWKIQQHKKHLAQWCCYENIFFNNFITALSIYTSDHFSNGATTCKSMMLIGGIMSKFTELCDDTGFSTSIDAFFIYLNIYHTMLAFITIHLAFPIFRIDLFKQCIRMMWSRQLSTKLCQFDANFFSPCQIWLRKRSTIQKKRQLRLKTLYYYHGVQSTSVCIVLSYVRYYASYNFYSIT